MTWVKLLLTSDIDYEKIKKFIQNLDPYWQLIPLPESFSQAIQRKQFEVHISEIFLLLNLYELGKIGMGTAVKSIYAHFNETPLLLKDLFYLHSLHQIYKI